VISVTRALDDYIESATEERPPDGKYHPSSMFLCDRQVMYQVRGVAASDPIDLKSKRRFYIGHRLHEAVQRAMESADGVEAFFPEFKVYSDEHNIAGSGDGLVFFDDGTAVVLEIKSTKRIAIKFGLPKEEHKKQAKVYAWAARNVGVQAIDETGAEVDIPPLGDRLKGILIAYLEKEELQIWEYFLSYEEAWDTEVQERLYELDAWREDEDSLPPRLPLKADGKKQWPCNYCPFKTRCWKVDPSRINPKEVF
jgi:CRISPR/Cas system-associated exonuclease Cas4 (RecB family)